MDSSLRKTHINWGVHWIRRGDREIPDHYGDPVAEHRMVRQSAGVADQSFRGKLRLRGKDRTEFLNGMVTNDVKSLVPGQGCYAALTTAKAKMLADVRIYCLNDSFLLDLEPEVIDQVQKHLDFYIISSDVTIENLSDSWGLISLFGPKASEILSKALTLPGIPEAEYETIGTKFESVDLLAARNEITGETGFDLYLPSEGLSNLFNKLIDSGAKPIGQRAINTLRVEAGIPRYGTDMDERQFPMEAGLTARAISETKGCYIGQETIARALAQGQMNRFLVGFEVDGETVPEPGTEIRSGDRVLGLITSAVESPTLGKVIAMGTIHRDFSKPGTAVEIIHPSGPGKAMVVKLPFYRRSNS